MERWAKNCIVREGLSEEEERKLRSEFEGEHSRKPEQRIQRPSVKRKFGIFRGQIRPMRSRPDHSGQRMMHFSLSSLHILRFQSLS